MRLPRQPGFKEARYAHLLCGPVEVGAAEPEQGIERKASDRDRIAALESAVEELKREFEEFRKRFE